MKTQHGVGFVTNFLEESGIAHEVVEHPPTYTAADEAAATHADVRHTAKTLVLHDRGGWRVAVLPANHRLDLERTRRLLGGTSHLRLATEEEMEEAFPEFEAGAMPPVGAQLPEVVDVRLLYRQAILCAGGDHRHAIRMDPRDLLKVAEPRVGDICEMNLPPRRKDFANLPKL
jgi:Ala-tRNA(Pro) deacylase